MASGWRTGYLRYRDFFLNIYTLYKKRQEIRTFLELSLTLATTSIFIVFAIRPTTLTIIDLVKQIKERQETVAKMDTKIKNLRTAQTILSQEQNRIKLLESAVPSAPEPASFTRQVEGFSNQSGSTIQNITVSKTVLFDSKGETPAQKKKNDNFPQSAQSLGFSSGFSGNFESIDNLLKSLENMRRPIKFDSLTLGLVKSTNENPDNIGLAITGRVPYFLTK
jgi:hypothetical protein